MKKQIIKQTEFKGLVNELCRQISNSNWRPDYIVGITRGGAIPAVMISHYFNVPMQSLNVSLRDTEMGPESNLWMAEDAFGYVSTDVVPRPYDMPASDPSLQKNILIVDDINDTGATFNWIMEDWRSGCMPNDPNWDQVWGNNVRFAVIADNASSKCNVKMNYSVLEINKAEEDCWIVFPYEAWWL